MTEYKLFAQRVGLVGVANIIASLSGLILLPILTKNLSIEEYGIWVQIGVTIGLLVPLTTLALSMAGHRFLSGEKDKKVVSRGFYSIFAVVFLISFIVSVLIFVFSRPLSIALFGGTEAEYLVKFAAPLILLGGMNSVAFQYFLTFQQVKKYSALLILEKVLQIILISCFLLAGFGLFGAIISLLILRLIMLILRSLLIILQIRVALPSYSLIKKYLTFSAPMIPAIIISASPIASFFIIQETKIRRRANPPAKSRASFKEIRKSPTKRATKRAGMLMQSGTALYLRSITLSAKSIVKSVDSISASKTELVCNRVEINIKVVKASIIGYCIEIFSLQNAHLPPRKAQEKIGIL